MIVMIYKDKEYDVDATGFINTFGSDKSLIENLIKILQRLNSANENIPEYYSILNKILKMILLLVKWSYINLENVKDISVIAFSLGSFIVLVRICMPFDAYRAMLVIGLGFVDMIALFSDYHYSKSLSAAETGIFGVNYSIFEGGFSSKTTFSLMLCIIVSIVCYVLFEYLAVRIHKWIDKKKEESIFLATENDEIRTRLSMGIQNKEKIIETIKLQENIRFRFSAGVSIRVISDYLVL